VTNRSFTAAARRSQGWWALEVTGDDLIHPAYTQVRRLDQAADMVRDLLGLHFGIGKDEVGHIEVVPVLDAVLAEEVTLTRQAREQAEKVRADATMQTRRTAQHLKAQGLAQRDISTLLGLSHQAVSQLLAQCHLAYVDH
jgi:predicted XRE-type DNA-binding protein